MTNLKKYGDRYDKKVKAETVILVLFYNDTHIKMLNIFVSPVENFKEKIDRVSE